MKRNAIVKQFLVLTVLFVCSACSLKDHIIGPRTEDAWDQWEEDQKVLKETCRAFIPVRNILYISTGDVIRW